MRAALALALALVAAPAEALTFRWVISPVVTVGGVRMPKVQTIVDPGRTGVDPDTGASTPKNVNHASVISEGQPGQVNGICLSLIYGEDLSNVDADTSIVNLFEADSPADMKAWLNSSLRQLGWTAARATRIRDRLVANGVDVTGIDMDTPLKVVLRRIAQRIDGRTNTTAPYFDGR